jgi:hypothetical protein
MEQLAQAIRDVLAEAIQVGGTTLRDYVNPDGAPGYFRQELFVYERAGEPCRRCRTPIRHRVLGQRSTYWCPACQRGLRPWAALTPRRPARRRQAGLSRRSGRSRSQTTRAA